MKGIWKNNEVKELFSVVEDYKDKNKPLREAFQLHAQKYGRKPNSVRNYYYHEVDNLKSDNKRLKILGIDLSNHNKTSIIYFSPEEEENLMNEIDKLVKNGVSVRKACYKLSGGDVGQMLRYQNKYRNYLSKKTQKQLPVADSGNIITFKKNQHKLLSESDIQSLFMGLVRLVKRTCSEESEEKYRKMLSEANENLRKVILELNNKERDYNKLKEDYLIMKNKNSKLADSVLKLRCKQAEKLRTNQT